MTDLLGWGVIAIVVSTPLSILIGALIGRRARREGGAPPSTGGAVGLDEVFHPAAHEARITWETELTLPAPAPTPDRGPGVIDAERRIVIDLTGRSAQNPPRG